MELETLLQDAEIQIQKGQLGKLHRTFDQACNLLERKGENPEDNRALTQIAAGIIALECLHHSEKETHTKKSPMKPIYSTQRAFTLLEIVFAILIIGIILVIAVPAVNSAIQDGRNQQAASNAQILNQAASRARLAGKAGPGTYGNDKEAALNWYLSENLTGPKAPNITWNSFQNGLWFANSITGNPDSYLSAAAAGTLSPAQVQELLRRFSELSPDLLQALASGGYLALSADALNQIQADGNAANLYLIGDTLITPTEAAALSSNYEDIISNGWSLYIDSWGFLDVATRDYIKDVFTNPAYVNQRNYQPWMWDAETESFIANPDYSYHDPYMLDLFSKIDALPDGSLKNQILDSLRIKDTPEGIAALTQPFQDDWDAKKADLHGTLVELNSYYQSTAKSALSTGNNKLQSIPTFNYSQINGLQTVTSSSNSWIKTGAYTSPSGDPYTVTAQAWNVGHAQNEYTQVSVTQEITDPSGYTYNHTQSYYIYARDPNTQHQITFQSTVVHSDTGAQVTLYDTPETPTPSTDDGFWLNTYQDNGKIYYEGSIGSTAYANNPSSYENTDWMWLKGIYRPPSVIDGKTKFDQNVLAYTDPAAYASNYQQ